MNRQEQQQSIKQKMGQKMALSPHQLQTIQLMQLSSVQFSQRVIEEIEKNPFLEYEPSHFEDSSQEDMNGYDTLNMSPEQITTRINRESQRAYLSHESSDDVFSNNMMPYDDSFIEKLEKEIGMLSLNDDEKHIAMQIMGSLDSNGYLTRTPQKIADSISFTLGKDIELGQVEKVRADIQKIEPLGLASLNIQECLLVQATHLPETHSQKHLIIKMLSHYWKLFENRSYEMLKNKLKIDKKTLENMFYTVRSFNPRPGYRYLNTSDSAMPTKPDVVISYLFEKHLVDNTNAIEYKGFMIRMGKYNLPKLKISSKYKSLWNQTINNPPQSKQNIQTHDYIRKNFESALWFIDSIQKRYDTMLAIFKAMIDIQFTFFRTGKNIEPMVMKDIAKLINMDISTVSRVVQGKMMKTDYGVYKLRDLFSESIATTSGGSISSIELKKIIMNLVKEENHQTPLSDEKLSILLQKKGYKVARRTIAKYRYQLGIPVASKRRFIL